MRIILNKARIQIPYRKNRITGYHFTLPEITALDLGDDPLARAVQ